VQFAAVEQYSEYLRYAAGAMQVDGHEATGGFEVANDGHLLTHALEIIKLPVDPGGTRDGETTSPLTSDLRLSAIEVAVAMVARVRDASRSARAAASIWTFW